MSVDVHLSFGYNTVSADKVGLLKTFFSPQFMGMIVWLGQSSPKHFHVKISGVGKLLGTPAFFEEYMGELGTAFGREGGRIVFTTPEENGRILTVRFM
jgi:hypothetical protein